jgi:serine/threonine protein kinase
VDDPTAMFYMYRRLKTMIGMFHINDFMVRIEHAFDNSQIVAEHFVVHRLLVLARTGACAGIDAEHHIVLPVCVQLCNIGKIPEPVRTMFHHISYSIQPVVAHSHTLDTWFRRYKPSTALIAKLCGQMAKALTHLHMHDIVHGDIKPTNTLVCVSNDDNHSNDDHTNDKRSDSDSDSDNRSYCDATNSNPVLYVIDYGMSGLHNEGDGTGGTKPFCAPETGNGCNSVADMDTYKWVANRKEHDMWSFALMFFTMVTLRKCVFYKKDYPTGFFDANGHVSASYIDTVAHEPLRSLFRRTLCPAETRLIAREFLDEINQINQEMH